MDRSKLKLAFLVDEKIDTNKDNLVQLDELVAWLNKCQDRYAQEDAERRWLTYQKKLDRNNNLGWSEYVEKEYDHLITIAKNSADPKQATEIKKSHDYYLKRDKRRWEAADLNQDGVMSKVEFGMFLYPEHYTRMHPVIVEEKLESLDENKDNLVSFDEFLAGLVPNKAQSNYDGQEAWIENEKRKFRSSFDQNKDDKLDKSELSTWVTTSELNEHSISEAQQLMRAADQNHDHRLTKEEILAAYNDFVNSHATDFGEAIRDQELTSHDEL